MRKLSVVQIMDGLMSVFATLAALVVGAVTLLMAGVQEEPGN